MISETAALQLGTDRGFMDRLVGWCEVDEHAGVQGKEGGVLSTLLIWRAFFCGKVNAIDIHLYHIITTMTNSCCNLHVKENHYIV